MSPEVLEFRTAIKPWWIFEKIVEVFSSRIVDVHEHTLKLAFA